ncbi:MAG: hypothetical protein HC804_01980 [Anaerolineae bacterium]|nr:hypothetical protein [Anaerolineae bacterium]
MRKIEEPPPPPQMFNPAIPDALASLILQAMAIEPKNRYASVTAMKAAFTGIVNGVGTARKSTAVPVPLANTPQRSASAFFCGADGWRCCCSSCCWLVRWHSFGAWNRR